MNRLYHYALLMRLHRPVGMILLLWPALIALWLASNGDPDPTLVLIFTLGVVMMRSCGCIVNDLADRHVDGYVRRTQNRPLVVGTVKPKEAYFLFAILLAAAFGLVCATNRETILLSIIAVLLACCYPLTKRFTHFPQVVLGAAYAWSIPMAYMAQGSTITLDAFALYVATVLWVIAYDTQYAMVDKEDDLKIGIKSTAIYFGVYDKITIFLLQILMLAILFVIGDDLNLNVFFTIGLCAAFLLTLYQQWLIRNREPQACLQAFLNNQWLGAVLFAGVFLGC